MIICPNCNSPMHYKSGTSNTGRDYAFYGCSQYPHCKEIVETEDAHKYDDRVEHKRPERTLEEESEDLREILLGEGYSWEEAEYARYMWEKD